MERISACASGAGRNLATSWPGKRMSAPKTARPRTFSTASMRAIGEPTICFSGISRLLSRHLNGAHDLVIAGAAAQVARQREADLGFVRVGVLQQQGFGGQEH